MGDFDLVLNPTNNPVLDEYAQNMVNYVQNNSYLGSWINRASKNTDGTPFVLQMGGFFSHTKRAAADNQQHGYRRSDVCPGRWPSGIPTWVIEHGWHGGARVAWE